MLMRSKTNLNAGINLPSRKLTPDAQQVIRDTMARIAESQK